MPSSVQVPSEEVLQDLAATLWRGLGHTFCRISLLDEKAGSLEVRAAHAPGANGSDWRTRLRATPTPFRAGSVPAVTTLLKRSDQAAEPILTALSARIGASLQWLLVVPITRDGHLLGLLDIGERRGDTRTTFDSTSVELAEAMAGQIALAVAISQDSNGSARFLVPAAIDQARLMCELLRRNRLVTRLEEELRRLRAPEDFPNLYQTVARIASNLLDCDKAVFLTHRPAQQVLEVDAVYGLPPELLAHQVRVADDLLSLVAIGAGPRILPSVALASRNAPTAQIRGTVLGVPVKREGRIEHVILLGEPQNLPFGPLEEEIIERFAHHAAHALETARVVSPEQRRFRPLQILQRIGDYIQSTTEEDKILHAVLTGITAGYGLSFNRAALFLLDDQGNRLIGRLGIGHLEVHSARIAWEKDRHNSIDDFERYMQMLEEGGLASEPMNGRIVGLDVPVDSTGEDMFSRAVREGRCIHELQNGANALPEIVARAFQPHSEVVVVPLVAHRRVIGVAICDNKFTQTPILPADIESLNLFATTAAIAVENRRKLRALFTASNTVVSADAQDPFQQLLDQTCHAAQATWVKLVLVSPSDTHDFHIVGAASRDGNRTAKRGALSIRPNGISKRVMLTGKAVALEDVSQKGDVANPILAQEGIQAALCLPWMMSGEPLGVMWIHYARPRRFSAQEITDLQMYVNHVAAVWDDREQLARMERTQRTFAQVAEATTHGDKETLRSIVRGTQEVLGCDTVTLYVHNEATDTLDCAAQMAGVRQPELAATRGAAAPGSFVYDLFKKDGPYVACDTASDPLFKDSRFTRDEEIKSVVAVPLKGRDTHVGILFVSYRRPSSFPPEELQNIQLFANHAAIAIQNAKLFEQRERQLVEKKGLLALSETLLASVTTQQIMDSAVQVAQRLLGADLACLAVVDSTGQIVVRSVVGWKPEHVGFRLPSGPFSHAGYIIEKREAVIVDNFSNETRFQTPHIRKEQGIESGVGVPMSSGGQVTGAMLVHTRAHRIFNKQEAEFLHLIANQTAIAINTAHLADAIAKQQGRRAALSMAMHAIQDSRRGEPWGILKTILQNAVDNLVARKGEQHMLGTLQIYDEAQDELVFKIFHPDRLHSSEAEVEGGKLPLKKGLGGRVGVTGRAFRERRPQRIADVRVDPDYLNFNGEIRSELAVPLLDEGHGLGVLNVESGHLDAFDEEDEQTLVALAELAGLVLRNAKQEEKLADLSHDFKRPITIIKSDVENLRAEFDPSEGKPPTEDDRRVCVERIYNAVRALSRIQSNVLSLAFIQAGATVLETKVCNVMSIVTRVVNDLHWEAERKRIALNVPAGAAANAQIDENKIEQVITNIVINAIKFSGPGGRVEVKVVGKETAVEIVVRDEGIGIAEEHHATIFRRFHRLDSSSTVEGSGLGLAVAKEYVERHGGHITLTSEPGKGSAFTVTLPIHHRRGHGR